MAQSFLIFDFGSDEQAAQMARHKLDGWKQAFRLGNKLQLKFERTDGSPADTSAAKPEETGKGKAKPAKQATQGAARKEASKEEPAAPSARIRVLVRLDFSDHERLSHHRWLERIPAEEPFKTVMAQVVRHGEKEFAVTTERFDALK